MTGVTPPLATIALALSVALGGCTLRQNADAEPYWTGSVEQSFALTGPEDCISIALPEPYRMRGQAFVLASGDSNESHQIRWTDGVRTAETVESAEPALNLTFPADDIDAAPMSRIMVTSPDADTTAVLRVVVSYHENPPSLAAVTCGS